jgi:hypothetical protein
MNDKPAKIDTLKQLCAELKSIRAKHARDFALPYAMPKKTRNTQ